MPSPYTWGFRRSIAVLQIADTGRNNQVFLLTSPILADLSRATVSESLDQPEWKASNTATGIKEVNLGTGLPKATPTTSRTLPSISTSTATRPTPPQCGGSDSSSLSTERAIQLALRVLGVAVLNARIVW